jgi:F-type H+-transporting ATPase subunit gamma
MSHLRELMRRGKSLADIRDILAAMKNLSLIELRKLSGFLESQQAASRSIERIAADFLHFFPELQHWPRDDERLYVLLGSERGLCGDFNEALAAAFEAHAAQPPSPAPRVVTLGYRIGSLLEDDPRAVARLPGVTAVEEVGAALSALMDTVLAVQAQASAVSLYVVHHREDGARPAVTRLLPPFEALAPEPQHRSPPLLYLSPGDFFRDLVRHHLFTSFHTLLYTALMVEHLRRVHHLEGATRRLDEQIDALGRQGQALRQEEITEEIEVILLSTGSDE